MATISADSSSIACSRCGYDLRGTVIGAGCPECGLPVNASISGIRVEGKFLVLRDNAVLPERCVITNEEVDLRTVKKTLYWYHPALILVILVNLLVFLIVALLCRKKCRVTYCLSETEAAKRSHKMLIATMACLMGITGMIVTGMNDQWGWFFASLLFLLASLIALVLFASTLRVSKAKGLDMWVRGAGPEFLRSLERAT